MSLGAHIEELRRRLFKCIAALLVVAAACLCFQKDLMEVVTRPHVWGMSRVSAQRAKARMEQLEKNNPFAGLRKMLENAERKNTDRVKIEKFIASLPAAQSAQIAELFNSFNTAEAALREKICPADLVTLFETRRKIEISLLEFLGEAAYDGEGPKALLKWTDTSTGTPGAFREMLRILDEERDIKEQSSGFQKLRVIKYQESFLNHLKVALICALFLASPLIFLELWGFVAVGLYRNERKVVYMFAPFSFLLFVAGVLFGYFVLIRLGLKFLGGYGDPALIETNLTLGFYLSIFLMLTFIVGVVFQLPLVMYVLARTGIVQPKSFSKFRRYFLVSAFLIAALLTPPDVITQILLGIPMIFLYELGIILAKIGVKKRSVENNDAGAEKKAE